MRQTLSVAIVAFNEEQNLRRTLASVDWADEVILVDSGSTDRTREIAREFGAKVYEEPWRGFAAQKNFALAHCQFDWVLSLDADEVVSPELRSELLGRLEHPGPAVAFRLPRRNLFLGRWVRHGGFYPDHKLRLFRRGHARFEDRPVHENAVADGPVLALRGDLLHYAYPTLELYIEHMNRYSSASVPLVHRKERTLSSLPAFLWYVLLAPGAQFLYNYVFRLGFLDGREGLLLHLYHAAYASWKYAKAWEACRLRDRSIQA